MNNIVESAGHIGRFQVGKNLQTEQIIFAVSHPGLAGSPAELDRVLAYVTCSNSGPRAIRVHWDGVPPHFQTGIPAAGGPITPADQYAPVMPNDSITVAVSRAVKVSYAPDVDSNPGDLAQGAFVVSWCCPPYSGRQAAPSPPGQPEPLSCAASGPAVPPILLARAPSALLGDYILTVSGGTAGTQQGVVNVTLFVNAAIVPPAGQQILLLIDNPASPVTGVNQFAGKVAGSNSVTFFGVPLVQPGPGATRVFRITNLHIATAGLASGTKVIGAASIAGSFSGPINNSQQTLALIA